VTAADQADTLTDASSARLSLFAGSDELNIPATPLVPTTGPQATAGAAVPAPTMTGYANTRGAAIASDQPGRAAIADDFAAVADEIRFDASSVAVSVVPERRDCRGRSHARQSRQRPRGAGRPRGRRTTSASRAGPSDDDGEPGPAGRDDARHLGAGNRGRWTP
jgi:hypothetical protein